MVCYGEETETKKKNCKKYLTGMTTGTAANDSLENDGMAPFRWRRWRRRPWIYCNAEMEKTTKKQGPSIGEIDIFSVKDMLHVKLNHAKRAHFSSSVGLLGEYSTGAMLARDGKTTMDSDPNAYGQEWQVRVGAEDPQLFSTLRAPLFPDSCILPPKPGEGTAGRFLMEETEAREACADWGDDEIDECIFDVMATGDVEMAYAGHY